MNTRHSVLTTMALADSFGWAMSAFEVWQFALDPNGIGVATPAYDEVLRILDELVADEILVEKHGYVAVFGHENYIEDRLRATQLIWGKRRKALRWAKWMIRLPYVEGVFAYGSLATGFVKKESDLDVYVVLRNGRIFTGRMLVTLFLEMFGARRTDKRIEDQICLNHFVRLDALTFEKSYRGAFSAWLRARMTPLALRGEMQPDDFHDANRWVDGYFPNLIHVSEREKGTHVEHVRSGMGNVIERLLGNVQLKRIAAHPKTIAGTGRVVASSREMIFHPSLPENYIMSKFTKQLDAFGLTAQ